MYIIYIDLDLYILVRTVAAAATPIVEMVETGISSMPRK